MVRQRWENAEGDREWREDHGQRAKSAQFSLLRGGVAVHLLGKPGGNRAGSWRLLPKEGREIHF